MARDFWGCAWCQDILWEDMLKPTLLWGPTGCCAPGWRISAISPTSPKDFLEAQGLLQSVASAGLECPEPGLLGAWAWSRAGSLPLGWSSTPLCVSKSFWGAPVVVCLDVWAGSLSGGGTLVLQDMTLPRQDSLCQLPCPWASSKSSRAVALC